MPAAARDLYLSALDVNASLEVYSHLSNADKRALKRGTPITLHVRHGSRELALVRLESYAERHEAVRRHTRSMCSGRTHVVLINPAGRYANVVTLNGVFQDEDDLDSLMTDFDGAFDDVATCVAYGDMLETMLGHTLGSGWVVLETYPCRDVGRFFAPDTTFAVELRMYHHPVLDDDAVRLPGGEVMGHRFKGPVLVVPVIVCQSNKDLPAVGSVFDFRDPQSKALDCYQHVASAFLDVLNLKTVIWLQPPPRGAATKAFRCMACGNEHDERGKTCRACSGCGLARYCSRRCSTADWKRHKVFCRHPGASFVISTRGGRRL